MANEIIDHIAHLRPTRATVDGKPIELTWAPNPAEPVVDNRVILVLPDLHLGDGGNADIFRGNDGLGPAHRERLEAFLTGAVAAKRALAQQGRQAGVVIAQGAGQEPVGYRPAWSRPIA
jgi:hypothetical protein